LVPDRHHIRGIALPKTKGNQSTEFGQRLKQLREARSLNVAEFAKRIQASPAAIWHWEHRGTLPRIGALNAIAEVLGVPRSYLETGKTVDGGNEIGAAPSGAVPFAAAQMSLEQLIKAIEAKGFDVLVKSKSAAQSKAKTNL
jgi:transcriptional regulator with XRE-family HTH domain